MGWWPPVENVHSHLPSIVIGLCTLLLRHIATLDEQITLLDRRISDRARADETARRLMSIPGIGPVCATRWRQWRHRPRPLPGARLRGLARPHPATEILWWQNAAREYFDDGTSGPEAAAYRRRDGRGAMDCRLGLYELGS